jgi:hypothetical protein
VTWSGTPVWPFTTVAVEDGDLRIGTSRVDQSAVAGVRTLNLANSSIRAQARLEGPGDLAAVFVRGVDSLGTAYALEVGDDGQLWLGLGGSWQSVASDLRPLAEDVVLQIDAMGRDVTAWAWRAGDPMPQDPVFRARSFALVFGYPGVYYGDVTRQGASGTAVFRYVRVDESPIPEPATGGLFASAGLAILGSRSRRRSP